MKSISNRFLLSAMVMCALCVVASSQLARMHGQEKVAKPEDVREELPGRAAKTDDSLPPIIYGNQTPFGQLPTTELSSVEPGQLQPTMPSQEVETQTVRKQSFDLLGNSPESEGILPERTTNNRVPLETIQPSSVLNPQPATTVLAPDIESSPLQSVAPSVPGSVPVGILDVAPTDACDICGTKSCTICCQPKCITKTILIPKYHTVWSSLFETRYRTEIKEQAYTIEQEVEHQVPRVIQETVMVPEPRIRTFQDFREEEYQVPVEEPYTVMVRKPKQRMVPVEREETYRYPVEQEYTVQEPREKIVTETKYKTITEKEPRQVKYTVEVERKRKRVVVDYVEGELPLEVRVSVIFS